MKYGPRRYSLMVLFLMASAAPLPALDPRLAITQYLHISWSQEEGIGLPSILALAQTTDGYLWLGTANGLWRFDGMRFVTWDSPGESLPELVIPYLLASPDGGLWIGTSHNICRLYHNRLLHYPDVDRWLAGRPRAVSVDSSGNLRVSLGGPVSEMALLHPDGAFRSYSIKDGLPAGPIHRVFDDARSNQWIAAGHDLCRWSPGKPAECSPFPHVSFFSLAGPRAPAALIQNPSVIQSFAEVAVPPILPKCLMTDRDGGAWLGTLGQGLIRVSGAKVERFTHLQGLSSDDVRAILEDREHDLWVATAKGLDRFREPQVVHVSTAEGLSNDIVTALQSSPDGSVSVGTLDGVNRVAGNVVTSSLTVPGFPKLLCLALLEDGAEGLWIGTAAGFGHFSRGTFEEVRTSEGARLIGVSVIARSPGGVVWLVDKRQGLFTIQDRIAQRASLPDDVRSGVNQFQFDRTGVLWLGYLRGGVASVNGDAVRRFFPRDGLAPGNIQAMAEDRSGSIWVGTSEGLSRFRNGVWTTWRTGQGVPPGGIFNIVEDDHDTLWFMTSQGLSRLSLADFNRSPDGSPATIQLLPYAQSDGERLAANPTTANRSIRSGDGRLWFSTENGVAIVDPAAIRRNPVPPNVVIEEVVADGQPLDLNSGAPLSFRARQVHIRYTGLSLMVPERVSFKTQLENFDKRATDAPVRTVDYVNLPPGRYRFHVQAANNDGVWNQTGASLSFRIEPLFYQTTWFAALCVLTAAAIVWGTHHMRVRFLLTSHRAISEERARLTRELHDSLLQGFVAVVYQLEAAARQIVTAPETGKQRLERAIEQADRSLGEARRTMLAMRIPALENSTLPEALSRIATELTEGTGIAFSMDVKGRIRHLPYDAQANAFVICREAITNAVNHAHPAAIHAVLAYSSKDVHFTVSDDGAGFNVQDGMSKNGHWGMAGMRERANQIGAAFSISSAPGKGTTVELVVPSRV